MQDQLLEALHKLSVSGLEIDTRLVTIEGEHAKHPGRDQRSLQSLRAASREVWRAHASTLKTLQALRQLSATLSTATAPSVAKT